MPGGPVTRAAVNDATKPLAEVERRPGPVGHVVGRFVLLGALGEGGSGEVFAAFDPVLDRRVAIKILHATGASGATVVREGRMLARLAHPGVVAVHDVGVHEDRAFLAMELVGHGDLRAWARRRDARAILRALVHAGHGLAAAHRAGIVHGDIKPANLLVGDDGLARVSDFGIARACEAAAAPHGAGGLQVGAGTPAYMAPEQHGGAPPDAASDQYAFCLSAWVALTGEHPYAQTGELSDEEATSATARDGDCDVGADRSASAVARAQVKWRPRWAGRPALSARIARALERGLAIDPGDRFASMDALLSQLSTGASRGRVLALASLGMLATAGMAAALVAAVEPAAEDPCSGAAAHMAEVWNPERRDTLAEAFSTSAPFGTATWDALAPAIDSHADAWVRMHTEACEATAVRGEQSSRVLDLRMGCLHRARAELDASLVTLQSGDLETVQNAHRVVDGLQPIERCADLEALVAAVPPPADAESAAAVEHARERLLLVQALLRAGRFADAEPIVHEAARAAAHVDHPPLAAELDLQRGLVHEAAGRYDEAETSLRRALGAALRHDHFGVATRAATDLASVIGHVGNRHAEGLAFAEMALSLSERGASEAGLDASAVDVIGMVQQRAGDDVAAEARYREAIARADAGAGDDPRVHAYRVNLAGALRSQGRFDEAETELRAALAAQETRLGSGHPDVALSRLGLARLLMQSGRWSDAEVELDRCLAVREAALGPDHPDLGRALLALGDLRAEQGRREEAEAILRRALGNLTAALGPEAGDVGVVHNSLAIVLDVSGRHTEAEAEIRRALAIQEAALGAGHPQLASVHDTLGATLLGQGRLDEAEAEQRLALALRRELLGDEHPAVATSRHNLGALLLRKGEPEAATVEFRAALAAAEATFGTDTPIVGSELHGLGTALARLDRHAEAAEVLERAWRIRDTETTPPEVRGTTAYQLARTLWEIGERSRARALAATAEAAYRAAEGGRWTPQIDAIVAWRSGH